MKQEINRLKQKQETTNERLSSLEAKQDLIYNQTIKLTKYHGESQEKFDRLVSLNAL